MDADQGGENEEAGVVEFQGWSKALEAAAMPTALQAIVRREIVAFLHFCIVHHAGASIILAKQYLAVAERQGRSRAREALRWWFRAAKGGGQTQGKGVASGAPTPTRETDGGENAKALRPQEARPAQEVTGVELRNVTRSATTDQAAASANAASTKPKAPEAVPLRRDQGRRGDRAEPLRDPASTEAERRTTFLVNVATTGNGRRG